MIFIVTVVVLIVGAAFGSAAESVQAGMRTLYATFAALFFLLGFCTATYKIFTLFTS